MSTWYVDQVGKPIGINKQIRADNRQSFRRETFYIRVSQGRGGKENGTSVAMCFGSKVNAHLIAAAPEMLEALIEMQQALTGGEMDRAMVKINKAIAKAEGREL